MRIEELSPGGFASCCYLVSEGKTAVLIDCSVPAEELLKVLKERDLTLSAILLTHGHFDHLLTLDAVSAATGAPVYLHEGDKDFPGDGTKNAYSLFFGGERRHKDADFLLKGGDTLTFGDLTFTVIHTPGHTCGSVLYECENALFTGDTVFAAGYGRCDLYGGDTGAMTNTLLRLQALPLSHTIYPGHGDTATLHAALHSLDLL